MANDKKFVVKKGLVAPNVDFANGGGSITATYLSTSNTLSFSGNTGQLFSITDSMSGTIFSVNDISGIPSIEVIDTGAVKIAETFGTVAIGANTVSGYKLYVNGNTLFGNSVTLNSTLIANGSVGTSGFVLTSNGTGVYWAAANSSITSVLNANNASFLNGRIWETAGAIGATVANTGAFTTLTASANVNLDSGTLFVDGTNNRVGISNTNPTTSLHVQGGALIGGDGASNYDLKLQRLNGGIRAVQHDFAAAANSPWILHGESLTWTGERAGTVESTQAFRPYYEGFAPVVGYKEFGFVNVTSGSFTGSNLIPNLVLKNDGTVGIGGITSPATALHVNGQIRVTHTSDKAMDFVRTGASTYSIEHDTSRIYFYNATNANTLIVMTNDNLVGIGLANPSYKLHANGDIGATGRAYIGSASSAGQLQLLYGATSQWALNSGSGGINNFNITDVLNGAERFRIDASGNVAIGSTSAPTKLFVNGHMSIANGFGIYANGVLGSAGFVLTSNGSSLYWANASSISGTVSNANNSTYLQGRTWETAGAIGSTVANTGAFTVLTISGNTVHNGNSYFNGGIIANGSFGTSGQVLTSNGTSAYWSNSISGFTGNTVSANATIVKSQSYYVNAAAGWVTMSLPSTVATGDIFIVHSQTGNTRILNNSINIMDVGSGNDLVLESGDTVWLQAVNTSAVGVMFTYPAGGTPAVVGNSSFSTTANNSIYAYGKQESQLSVANAVYAQTSNNATYAYGKQENQLSVANAVFATTANNALRFNGKQESQLSVANAVFADTANNALRFNGKQEAQLSVANAVYAQSAGSVAGGSVSGTVATANNATYAYGKQESQLSVANSVFAQSANNSDYLDGFHATYFTNATNISTGTLAEPRLPFRMDQNVRSTDNVTFANLTITGSVTVTGNVTSWSANNLQITDNMIYLNANSQVANPDLGFTGNYNDGIYRHAGFFRDATDGVWKVFDQYLPEPDASPYIDTANNSFRIANFQANVVTIASANVGGTLLTSTTYGGTANNSTYAYGKQESQLSVASATSATNAGTANNSTYAYGKQESQLSVANAVYAQSAGSVLGGNVSGTVANANNASYLQTRTWDSPYAIGSTVANSGAFTTITASANVNFDSGTLFTDATSNRVGIGTTTPVVPLQVIGSIRFASDTPGTNYLQFERTGSNAWKLTSDGVGDVFNVIGNNITTLQNLTVGRGGLIVTPTLATATNAIEVNHTWNNATNIFTSLKVNATDTTSNASSMLMDLRVGGTSLFNVKKSGNVGVGNTSPGQTLQVDGTVGIKNGLVANGSFGTAGHVLTSNGTAIYWAAANANISSIATANNATYAYGKQESQLSVAIAANATFADTANNSLRLNGKQESQLSVANAVYAQSAGSVLGGNVSGTVANANNSTYLDGRTWQTPFAIGSTVANTGAFTTLTASANVNLDSGTLFVDATTNRVGVANLTPISALHVQGAATIDNDDVNGTQLIIRGSTNTNNRLYIGYDTDDNVGRITAITEGTAFRNLMLNAGGGNVGIGSATSAPTKLFVNGHMSIANGFGIYANGTLGANGLVLTSNGTSLYWGSVSASGGGFTGNTVSANSTIVKNQSYNVNAAAGWVTMTMPSTVATGDIFIVHSLGGNTRILNNSINIMDVGAGNDLVLENGETVWLQAVNATAVDILFTYPAGGVPSLIANATFATTANNSLYAYGKQESQLSVASAAQLTTTRTIGDVNFNGTANIVPERIYLKDTRAVDFAPTTYPGVTLHLKNNGADGLTDGGTYHGILNLQHWTDTSGGNIHQLALTDNNNIWIRQSTNSTAWGSWAQVVTTISGLAANANFATTANNALRLNGKQESQLSVATANNATYAYGKQESQLSVASATSATSSTTANNATYAYGKQESQLSVASATSATSATTASTANNATYAYGKQESQLSVASATTAGSASSVSGAVAATTLTASANVNLDSGTLVVDATTNRVGIGTTTPLLPLQVTGQTHTSSLSVSTDFGTYTPSGFGQTTPNSGLSVNASSVMAISAFNGILLNTNSTTRLKIDSGGNVAIGETSSTPTKLFVNGHMSVANGFGIYANGTLGANGLVLTSNGTSLFWGSVSAGGGATANNSTYLDGRTWATPFAIGSTVANTGAFTTLTTNQHGGVANTVTATTGQVISYAPMNGGRTYYGYDLNGQPALYEARFVNVSASTNVPSGMTTSGYWFGMGAGDVATRGFSLMGTDSNGLWYKAHNGGSWTRVVDTSTITTLTANNSTYAYGKQESQLSVASATSATSATTATTANNSTYAYGKQESQLSVASATNSTNSTNATNANNSTWLGGRTWASPSAIGSTVANTGAFTTLSAKPNQTGAVAGLDVSNNSVGIFMVPRASSGSYNNLVSTNDNLIYFSNNTVNNGNLVIGSWTDRAAGYGMRMSSQNYEVAVTANSFVTNANNIFNSVTTLRSGGAAINLTGATSNRIVWNESGVAAPSFASYSNGVKLVLYGNNNGTNLAGYAIGIESGTMWFGTDSTASGFKWYGGTTNYMSANTTALYHTGNITAYSSDKRLKKNITPIEEPIKKIQQIGGYTFDWDKELCEKYEFIPGQTHEHGVIAQEIEKIIPDAVTRAPFDIGKDGESKTGENYLTVRYDRIVPLLIEAVKEQQKEIDTLKELVKTLINKEQDNG